MCFYVLLVWSTLVPANLGVKMKTNKNDRRDDNYSDPFIHNASLEQTEEDSETKVEIPLTFYEMNDMVIDEVLHGDPGAYAVIKKIVEYIEEASLVEDFDFEQSGGKTPVHGIIAAATADGGPAKRWLDFQATDIEEEG